MLRLFSAQLIALSFERPLSRYQDRVTFRLRLSLTGVNRRATPRIVHLYEVNMQFVPPMLLTCPISVALHLGDFPAFRMSKTTTRPINGLHKDGKAPKPRDQEQPRSEAGKNKRVAAEPILKDARRTPLRGSSLQSGRYVFHVLALHRGVSPRRNEGLLLCSRRKPVQFRYN